MSESKIEKSEIADMVKRVVADELAPFARAAGGDISELNKRVHSLAVTLDCLLSVIEARVPDWKVGDEIKAELARRQESARRTAEANLKAQQDAEPTPLISVP